MCTLLCGCVPAFNMISLQRPQRYDSCRGLHASNARTAVIALQSGGTRANISCCCCHCHSILMVNGQIDGQIDGQIARSMNICNAALDTNWHRTQSSTGSI